MTVRALCIGLWLAASLGATPARASAGNDVCQVRGATALKALAAGHFTAAEKHFSAALAKAVPTAKLKQVWMRIQGQVGEFQSMGASRPVTLGGHALWLTPMDFSAAQIATLTGCDDDDRLTTLRMVPMTALPAAVREVAGEVPSAASTASATSVGGVVTHAVKVATPVGPLGGTLTLPEGGGPFPAVVLVQGSGPHDRDESIGPNKPFRDIAVGLARHGVASLRYDKRTFTYGAKVETGRPFTVDQEVTDDAIAAVKLLAARRKVDPRRVFVVGHSLGGMMAPRIGERLSDLAGLVLLAAPARPLLEVSRQQVRESDASADDIAHSEQALQAEIDLLAAADPAHPPTGEFAHVPQSYWLSLQRYHQVAVAKKLTMPMLIMQGMADFQVSPRNDFARWEKALGGHSGVRFKRYPDLSHLFMQAGEHRDISDYEVPGHVAANVIDDIASWIQAVAPAAKPLR